MNCSEQNIWLPIFCSKYQHMSVQKQVTCFICNTCIQFNRKRHIIFNSCLYRYLRPVKDSQVYLHNLDVVLANPTIHKLILKKVDVLLLFVASTVPNISKVVMDLCWNYWILMLSSGLRGYAIAIVGFSNHNTISPFSPISINTSILLI